MKLTVAMLATAISFAPFLDLVSSHPTLSTTPLESRLGSNEGTLTQHLFRRGRNRGGKKKTNKKNDAEASNQLHSDSDSGSIPIALETELENNARAKNVEEKGGSGKQTVGKASAGGSSSKKAGGSKAESKNVKAGHGESGSGSGTDIESGDEIENKIASAPKPGQRWKEVSSATPAPDAPGPKLKKRPTAASFAETRTAGKTDEYMDTKNGPDWPAEMRSDGPGGVIMHMDNSAPGRLPVGDRARQPLPPTPPSQTEPSGSRAGTQADLSQTKSGKGKKGKGKGGRKLK